MKILCVTLGFGCEPCKLYFFILASNWGGGGKQQFVEDEPVMVMFWVLRLIGRYHNFRETYYFHFQG
jgi:hypothetical protein